MQLTDPSHLGNPKRPQPHLPIVRMLGAARVVYQPTGGCTVLNPPLSQVSGVIRCQAGDLAARLAVRPARLAI